LLAFLARWVGGSLCVVALAIGALALHVGVFDGNRHVVAAELVYRSAQLSLGELREHVARHGIRRIVNLRSVANKTPEYEAERALCAELGLEFVGLPLSPTHLPKPEVLRDLIACFRSGPFPILVHCEKGADRTGLASTVYDLIVTGKELDRALRDNLSWRTGHVGLGRERAMRRFFELYRDTRGELDFAAWAERVYPAKYDEIERPIRRRDARR
jgi:protein tyrosine phosphatase (PTP) superfamily phosphohydrolase (DUF442 family)